MTLRHKFHARPTTSHGIRFDSKLEANYYERLLLEQKAGKVVMFLRQVPLHLPGGTKMVVDFQVFRSDGTVEFIDTKGHETQVFKTKLREVEAHYPIKIRVIKSAGW